MTGTAPAVVKDGKDGKNGKDGKVDPNRPSKKELFERYYAAESKREKAEAESSAALKAIKDNYGKGPFRLKDGVKTIVEREVNHPVTKEVIGKLFFFRSVGGEIQEIE